MTKPDAPKDGDFASWLQAREKNLPAAAPEPQPEPRQTVQQVLVDGEEPTEEFLEEWNALEAAPELPDEELARQALEAPGDDGDVNTPE